MVMKDGKAVETGSRDDIFEHPKQAYTRKLIAPQSEQTRRSTAFDFFFGRPNACTQLQIGNFYLVGNRYNL